MVQLCVVCVLQLFEVSSSHSERSDKDTIAFLHSQLKTASVYSGFRGRPSVLLVHGDLADECLADVCAFLKDGSCCLNPSCDRSLLFLQCIFTTLKFDKVSDMFVTSLLTCLLYYC